jgi:hypothetical protein
MAPNRLGPPNLAQLPPASARAVGITAAEDLGKFRTALRSALTDDDRRQQPQVVIVDIDQKPAPPYGWLQTQVARRPSARAPRRLPSRGYVQAFY